MCIESVACRNKSRPVLNNRGRCLDIGWFLADNRSNCREWEAAAVLPEKLSCMEHLYIIMSVCHLSVLPSLVDYCMLVLEQQ